MAAKKFRCSKCKRSFSMAAHLARHEAAIHGRRKSGASKSARPKTAGRASAVGSMEPESAGHLVSNMQCFYDSLVARREEMDAEITALGDAINVMANVSGPTKRAPGRAPSVKTKGTVRGARAGSLKTFIVKVMGQRSTPMGPRDIAARVKQSGYKSKAQDLTKAVSNALPQLKQVRKVGFGQYQIR